jgi:hypothetical protein
MSSRLPRRGKRGRAESPFGCVVEWKDGKATRVLSFLDRKEALEAAGLRESTTGLCFAQEVEAGVTATVASAFGH